ncbi:MAG: DNA mismatch repair endonuclease MutL [Phycisphaerae bacterium]
MGKISILDNNMVNMIAAGEVIERPASVVKELMENSIDSGATKITVSIEDGGRKLISVTDNGCGMQADDLEKAFEPHATSKIRTSQDLRSIATLGFRGEALASIASIAQVKAASRTKEPSILLSQESCGAGSSIEIDCGIKGPVMPCNIDYGTSITVRDIFYKLPARRKFLRTANTEMSHITEQFIRIALSNTSLDLSLLHNSKQLYHLSADQSLRSRIAELFSNEIAESLLEISSSEKSMQIYALSASPELSRTNSHLQYIFLNGRFIRDKFISHAIREAYRSYIEWDRYPVIFLFIKMSCDDFDVNVHPTKTEVRFYNSNLVHSQILAALREKLLSTAQTVRAKLPVEISEISTESKPASKIEYSEKINQAMAEFFQKHRHGSSQPHFSFRPAGNSLASVQHQRQTAPSQTADLSESAAKQKFIQIHDCFIVTETEDGFVIIDQHALHERVMYNDLKKRTSAGKLESQKLLIPESFQITEIQKQAFDNHQEIFEQLGIEIEPFGPKTMAVQSFPTLLSKACAVDFVRDLLDLLCDAGKNPDTERLLDDVLNMAACKAAIKAGQQLSDNEILQLLEYADSAELSGRCPHGRPTTIKFSVTELQKQFKRT